MPDTLILAGMTGKLHRAQLLKHLQWRRSKWLHRHSCLSTCWVWVHFPSKKCFSLKNLAPCCQEHCWDLSLSLEGHQLTFNERNSGLHITRGCDPGPHHPWADQYDAIGEKTRFCWVSKSSRHAKKCPLELTEMSQPGNAAALLTQKRPKQDLLAGSW